MDPELQAMAAVQQALAELSPVARARVLQWAASRLEIASPIVPAADRDAEPEAAGAGLEELLFRAQPSNGAQRALIAAYHLQELQGRVPWGGGDVNDALKRVGAGLTNVTRTLGMLAARNPPLVMRVSKSGRTAQARNRYRLSSSGTALASAMLAEGTRTR